MKLENVDLSKLQLNDLPKFDKCPCELCDDGCFDRAGYQHYPQCQRKPVQRTNLSLNFRCPLSHYKETFKPATNASGGHADHRRQPCPPAPDNEIPISFKNSPMLGISAQREHYAPPSPSKISRALPKQNKPTDSALLRSLVPMETKSSYQAEYIEKPLVPAALRPLKDSNTTINEPTLPISSVTTNRSHYKPWDSARSQPFAEFPANAGHVLFPGVSRSFSTSTGSAFVKFPKGSQVRPPPRIENSENFKLSGPMDLRTNYRDSYITHDLTPAQSAPLERKDKSTEEKVYKRRPMFAVSQTSLDFRPYPNHRRSPPVDVEIFASHITLGSSLNSTVNTSQYRTDYQGIDTKRHPRQPPAGPKDHKKPYVPPVQKMDTMSVTQRDFQPLDLSAIPPIRLVPLKASLPMNDQNVSMETETTSQYYYKPYESIKPNRLYGDPIPQIYVPPSHKFEGSTTTGETFRGKPGSRARPYVPDIKMLKTSGEHDFRTNYRVDYHPHGLTLCAAKAFAIAQKKQKPSTPIAAQ